MNQYFRRVIKHFIATFQQTSHFRLLILSGSLALTYLNATIFLANPYGFYVPRKILIGLTAFPLIFLGLSYLIGVIRLATGVSLSRRNWLEISFMSAIVATVLFFAFPNPRPLIDQNHQWQLIASGTKNKFSTGSIVEVRQIRTLDGKDVPVEQFRISGDWQVTETGLYSAQGGSATVAEMSGMIPGGAVISLRYLADGGIITIDWDGEKKVIDLYTPSAPTIENFVFDGFSWSKLTWLETALVLTSYFGYFLGLFVGVFIFSYIVRSGLVQPKIGLFFLIIIYGVISVYFINGKISYDTFSGNRPFRDSRSYVQNADLPILSPAFWAGERPFTFPLALKLLDVHYSDNWSNRVMERVQSFQVWLSIASWWLLAFLISMKIRQNWLKPFAFATILFFGLNLEIGIWDGLMLSESVSFSFFALMIAFWTGWQVLSEQTSKSWIQGFFLVTLSVITILYSFARDSNLYFLLIAAAVFLFRIIFKEHEYSQKRKTLIYVILILLIAVFQNISISVGNRWQVFIYDHLSYRILRNDSAITFFSAHGLPITDALMGIVKMEGFQYQEMINSDPKMLQVKQWVDQSGKLTYLLFLLNDFGNSLMEPIRQIPKLMDGSTLSYHFPIYASRPFSQPLMKITNAFYFRSPVFEGLVGFLLLVASIFWIFKGQANSPWFIVTILILSIYPLMFITWHGEPMEIERHALQIGIQFRLAAWMAIIFVMDALTIRIFSPIKDPPNSKMEESHAEI